MEKDNLTRISYWYLSMDMFLYVFWGRRTIANWEGRFGKVRIWLIFRVTESGLQGKSDDFQGQWGQGYWGQWGQGYWGHWGQGYWGHWGQGYWGQ